MAARLVVESEILTEIGPPPGLDLERLHDLIQFALTAEAATGVWNVTVLLTDDARLRRLHYDFMGIDTETDVMTFPYNDGAARHVAARGGEIVISVQRASEQASDFAMSLADELRFLVLHGLLHLRGWDDRSAAERAAMLARQTELMGAFDLEAESG